MRSGKECIPHVMFHTYTSGGGGLFADSPGFSQASLAKVMRATLRELFPEVQHSSFVPNNFLFQNRGTRSCKFGYIIFPHLLAGVEMIEA